MQALRRAQALETAPLAGAERIAALYASALASLELREPARAQAALDAAAPLARQVAPDDARSQLVLALAQAQTWQAAGPGAARRGGAGQPGARRRPAAPRAR